MINCSSGLTRSSWVFTAPRMGSEKTVRERLPLSHGVQKRPPCKSSVGNRTGEFLVREKQKLSTPLKANPACRTGSAVSLLLCLSTLTGVQKQSWGRIKVHKQNQGCQTEAALCAEIVLGVTQCWLSCFSRGKELQGKEMVKAATDGKNGNTSTSWRNLWHSS